jgi:uncharacterized protein (TIGR02466 family)
MIEKRDFFPTPVYCSSIDNFAEMNPKIIEKIYQIKEIDPGLKKTNILGWHSNYDLHLNPEMLEVPEFLKVRDSIYEAAQNITGDIGYKIPVVCSHMWININNKYASNEIHDHPHSLLSGSYYLQSPEPVSYIKFYDPRPVNAYCINDCLPEEMVPTDYTRTNINFKPIAGNFVFFQSWLKHSVEVNLSDEDRISLSFNFIFDPKYKKSFLPDN